MDRWTRSVGSPWGLVQDPHRQGTLGQASGMWLQVGREESMGVEEVGRLGSGSWGYESTGLLLHVPVIGTGSIGRGMRGADHGSADTKKG